jgi:predicted permease
VISYAYWQRRFGASPTILGAGILINQVPFTIVGVEPRGFSGIEVGRPPDITVPLRARDLLSEGAPLWDQVFSTWILIMGRLKDSVTQQGAQQDLNLIYRQVNADAARSAIEQRLAREWNLIVESAATGASSGLRASYERWLRLLLILLGAVLLLASLNVATLLLSRSGFRQREITTRLALGAGRWRIVRQLLTESIVLAGLGGALGLLIATWGSRTLLRIATSATERLPVDLTPDPRVIAFSMGLSALTCLVFGLIPALRATASRRIVTGREVGGGHRRRLLDRALVASQVALSLALLVCAGLFLRSLQNLRAQDTGYDRSSVLMFSVDAKLAGKPGHDVPNSYQKLLDELRSIPGAQAVSISSVRPVSDGYYFISVVTSVGDRDLPDDQKIRIAFNNVGPGYFSTLGIPLLIGRDFDRRDTRSMPKVAIISERMARHFSGNPVGQRIVLGREDVREVIGVVKDIRYANVKDAPREVVYVPIFQGDPKAMWYTPTFEIRYAGAAMDMIRSVREVVTRVEPGLTIFRAKTLEVQTEESLSRERLLALLTSYCGGFALLLACIGLYGLMTCAVAQRTAELGLRMALGALPRAIRWMVLRDSATTVVAGVGVGLLASGATVRLVRSQLYGVQPYDPATLLWATLLLIAVALVAAYLPAARASRIDPMTALRHE